MRYSSLLLLPLMTLIPACSDLSRSAASAAVGDPAIVAVVNPQDGAALAQGFPDLSNQGFAGNSAITYQLIKTIVTEPDLPVGGPVAVFALNVHEDSTVTIDGIVAEKLVTYTFDEGMVGFLALVPPGIVCDDSVEVRVQDGATGKISPKRDLHGHRLGVVVNGSVLQRVNVTRRNRKVIQSEADLADLSFEVGFTPGRIALTRNGTFGFCASSGGDQIALFVTVDLPQDLHNGGNLSGQNTHVFDIASVTTSGGFPSGSLTARDVAVSASGNRLVVLFSVDPNPAPVTYHAAVMDISVLDDMPSIAASATVDAADFTPTGGSYSQAIVNLAYAPTAIAASPVGGEVLVSHGSDGRVSIFDAENVDPGSTLQELAAGTGPSAACFAPDGSKAYVVNSGSGDVTVVDFSGTTPVAAQNPNPAGHPVSVGVSVSNASYVVASDEPAAADFLRVFAVGTGALNPARTPDVDLGAGFNPESMAVVPDAPRLAVIRTGSAGVSYFDISTVDTDTALIAFESDTGLGGAPGQIAVQRN